MSPLLVPQVSRQRIITNNNIIGTVTPGTACPSSATTLLDGAVTELISAAANTQTSWAISIFVTNTGAAATAAEAALDILIGGATDDVLISALLCGYASAAGAGTIQYFFPIWIPEGVRIAGRFASVRTSISAQVVVMLHGGSPPFTKVGRKVTTLGVQANNARGQLLTVAANGAAASATQISASTPEDYFCVQPGFQPETDSTITPDKIVNIGVGVGAATEERMPMSWLWQTGGNESLVGPWPHWPMFQDVPAGSRLTILGSTSGAVDAAYGGLIYAVS